MQPPMAYQLAPYGHDRMAASPREGVVDSRLSECMAPPTCSWPAAPLFPTTGNANPTLTIVALALRLADHLKEATLAPDRMPAGGTPAQRAPDEMVAPHAEDPSIEG